MSTKEQAPECQLDMHPLCVGTKAIRRDGAPSWEVPIQTLHCGCPCHRGVPMTSPVSRPKPTREG